MIVLVLAVVALLYPSLIRAQITAGAVEFDAHPDSDLAGGKLSGVLYLPSGYSNVTANAYAAVVMMHGCGGMWSDQNISAVNTRFHFALPGAPNLQNNIEKWGIKLAQSGIVALAVDSFTKRCPTSASMVVWQKQCVGTTYAGNVDSYTTRVLDLQAAYNYLDSRPEIDNLKIAALGWSQGAQATMVEAAVTGRLSDIVKSVPTKFRRTVSFYPGCGTDLGFGAPLTGFWRPHTKMHLHVGVVDGFESDCSDRVEQARSLTSVEITFPEYPGADHSFDNVKSTGLASAEMWPVAVCGSPTTPTGHECAMRSADINGLAFLQAGFV